MGRRLLTCGPTGSVLSPLTLSSMSISSIHLQPFSACCWRFCRNAEISICLVRTHKWVTHTFNIIYLSAVRLVCVWVWVCSYLCYRLRHTQLLEKERLLHAMLGLRTLMLHLLCPHEWLWLTGPFSDSVLQEDEEGWVSNSGTRIHLDSVIHQN